MTRTLVTTAVLFLLSVLQSGCMGSVAPSGPLFVPDERLVQEIGRFDGLPLTLSVNPRIRLGGPVMLVLKATNVTDHTLSYSQFHCVNLYRNFAFWLTVNGEQVSLSEFGAQQQPRHTVSFAVDMGGPPGELRAGETKSMSVDLSLLFQITKRGQYTVIAEQGPFMYGEESTRGINAAKTSFEILP